MVVGFGWAEDTGHLVVNARATEPAKDPQPGMDFPANDWYAPAEGFVRARDTEHGDLSGSVECIGTQGDVFAVVAGTLDSPVVVGGETHDGFHVLVTVKSDGVQLAQLGLIRGAPEQRCKMDATFFIEWPPVPVPGRFDPFIVQRGQFQVLHLPE